MANGNRKLTQSKQSALAVPLARQLTCLAVTGFGNRTDYVTGRVLNLDKTFDKLVRPACDLVNVNCFRNIDLNLSGSVDAAVYRWIYQADIVIADISTLNAQVFYELGLRHAMRPSTTIIIAESVLMQRLPFDLSSFVIHQYEHGGDEISSVEQNRFVDHLSEVLAKLIKVEQHRLQFSPEAPRETDSPVFQYLSGMTPPNYHANTYIEAPAYVPPAERTNKVGDASGSLASVIEAAEAAKRTRKFDESIRLFKRAIEVQTSGKYTAKPDVFLAQRLALVTYKAGERRDEFGNLSKDSAIAALMAAEEILAKYCQSKITNDPETLGLAAAINRRLFELTGDLAYLDRAIRYSERGFYVKRDYYNGINVATMYTLQATLLTDRFDAIASFGHGNTIRRHVVEICQELMDDEAGFARRGDREWILLTLAEAFQGLGDTAAEARLRPMIDGVASDFGKQSYINQACKLKAAIKEFEQRFGGSDGEVSRTMSEGAPAVRGEAASLPVATAASAFTPAVAGFVELWVGELMRQINLRSPVAVPDPSAAGAGKATDQANGVPQQPMNPRAGADCQAADETKDSAVQAPTSMPVAPPANTKRSKIFLSYSHRDREWLDLVKQHLRGLQNTGLKLDIWDDSKIRPGKEWKPAIDSALSEARVAILLITRNYLDSDFIVNKELPPLLEAARQNGTEILSVLCSPVPWDLNALSVYQAINNPETEVLAELDTGKQDRILIRLVRQIAEMFSLKGRVDPEDGGRW